MKGGICIKTLGFYIAALLMVAISVTGCKKETLEPVKVNLKPAVLMHGGETPPLLPPHN